MLPSVIGSLLKERMRKRAAQIRASLSVSGRAESNPASVCQPPLLGSVHSERYVSAIPAHLRKMQHTVCDFLFKLPLNEDGNRGANAKSRMWLRDEGHLRESPSK